MTLVWRRCALLALCGLLAAAAAAAIVPSSSTATLCLLGAGVAAGELMVLRVGDVCALRGTAPMVRRTNAELPLSFAVLIVLASSFDWRPAIATFVAAQVVVFPLRFEPRVRERVQRTLHHLVIGAIAFGTFHVVFAVFGQHERLSVLLGTLIVTVLAMVFVDAGIQGWLHQSGALGHRGRRAWSAISSSGMLMAIGERGVAGSCHLGVWGPMLFAIPLFAAWYSFERFDAATRAHQQTIEALAMAPEFAGLVAAGHADRVADLSVSIGRALGLGDVVLHRLATAARLHHLGAVTLDDPAFGGPLAPAATIAHVTADMLRGIAPLAGAGDIVARAGSRRSFTFLDARGNTAAMVLQHANAFDEAVSERRLSPAVAIEGLREAVGVVGPEEHLVIDALELVVIGTR